MEWIRVPLLNANENELTVVGLSVREGDQVRRGQMVVTLESTKAASDVEAPVDGFVCRVLVVEGQRVAVGDRLCAIGQSADEPVEDAVPSPVQAGGAGARATVKARELAEAHGVDLSALGVPGVIRERDVQQALDRRAGAKSSPPEGRPAPQRGEVERAGGAEQVLIFGARGHASVLIDLLREGYRQFQIVGAVDDSPGAPAEVLGVPVIGTSADLARIRAGGVPFAVLGIGAVTDNRARVPLFRRLIDAGFHIPSLVHPRACVEPSARVSRGAQIFAGAIVGSRAEIGENVIVNSGAIVSHDCVIGAHAHLTPGAILAGGVSVGERSVVGMGATVYLGTRVGRDVLVANGVHVLRDVPSGAVVRTTASG